MPDRQVIVTWSAPTVYQTGWCVDCKWTPTHGRASEAAAHAAHYPGHTVVVEIASRSRVRATPIDQAASDA